MAKFEDALPFVFKHEGRYSNDDRDPGKETNYGISLRFLMQTGDLDKDGWPDGDVNHDGSVNADDIKLMTKDDAAKLYRLYFWDKNGYEKIGDQMVATKIFDLAVNMGSFAANKIAQRAVRAAVGLILPDDGIMGLKTLTGINMCKPDKLMVALKAEAAGYYRMISYKGAKDFLTGWLSRAYSDVIIVTE